MHRLKPLIFCCLTWIPVSLMAEPLSCLIEPSLDVHIGTPLEGVLAEILVDRSDRVTKGQVIARLEAGVEQAAINTQIAREGYAQRRITRSEELQQAQLMSDQELDDRRTEYQLARLELAEKREQLNLRVITSPIDGVVVERFHDPGNLIMKEQIVRLMQLDPLHVELVLSVDWFGSIHSGDVYTIRLQHLNLIKEAVVTAVDPIIDPASGTFRVRLTMPNPDYQIPSGLQCELLN